jgi:hypothetical protein
MSSIRQEQGANILVIVPGDYVSPGLWTLPDPVTAKDELIETVIDLPNLGKVRFTCRRLSSRKGKTRSWFWTAESAIQMK